MANLRATYKFKNMGELAAYLNGIAQELRVQAHYQRTSHNKAKYNNEAYGIERAARIMLNTEFVE